MMKTSYSSTLNSVSPWLWCFGFHTVVQEQEEPLSHLLLLLLIICNLCLVVVVVVVVVHDEESECYKLVQYALP